MKIFIFIAYIVILLCAHVRPVQAEVPTLHITGVRISAGEGKSDWDFVEISNQSDIEISLKGYRLVKRTKNAQTDTLVKSWTDDYIVTPHTRFYWANSSAQDIAADFVTSGSLANDNGIALRLGADNDSVIADSFSWGSTENTFPVCGPNPQPAQVLVRDQNGSCAAQLIPEIPDTTTEPVVPIITPRIIFSEIYPNPLGTDEGNEVVEFYNNGNEPVSLNGHYLDVNTPKRVPTSHALQISELTIFPTGYVSIVIPSDTISLTNTGGTICLYNQNKIQLLCQNYPKSEEQKSYQFIDGAWAWAVPTLGLPNQILTSASYTQVKVTGVLVDPPGEDEGKQQIIVHNISGETVVLGGFVFDDEGEGADVSGNAWFLPKTFTLFSGESKKLTIPPQAFVLNHQSDTLRLISDSGILVQSITYENAPPHVWRMLESDGVWRFQSPENLSEKIVPITFGTVTNVLSVPQTAPLLKQSKATKVKTALKPTPKPKASTKKAVAKTVTKAPASAITKAVFERSLNGLQKEISALQSQIAELKTLNEGVLDVETSMHRQVGNALASDKKLWPGLVMGFAFGIALLSIIYWGGRFMPKS